jgi:glycosyltransferase involved in cell wall biosynthesis
MPIFDMRKQPSVSLVIPMFNEEENIEHALACAVDALARYSGEDWEIVVVDDASRDRSAELVARESAAEPRIRMVRHEVNRKLGASLKTGFAAVRKDVVLYMDADLPFDPDAIGRALQAMKVTRADLIAGYRLDRTAEGFRRTVYSYCYNTLIGLLFGWPHRDINFSFKLIRREVLEAIELKSEGSLIDAELIVKAKNLGFVIQQLGLDYFPRTRGSSTLSSPAVILKIFRELITLYPEMRHPRRRGHLAPSGESATPEPVEAHAPTLNR